MPVPLSSVTAFTEAISMVGIGSQTGVYWAGRATLVSRFEDLQIYDRAFRAFWLADPSQMSLGKQVVVPVTLVTDDSEHTEGLSKNDNERPGITLTVRYSNMEVLREKDFSKCTDEELTELAQAMRELDMSAALRRTRRMSPASSQGSRFDVRATVRHALRTEGEPVIRRWLQCRTRPRRLVLLCDVSGSMEPYSRALLRFMHLAMSRKSQVEAFTLGTRLTRISRELATHDPDAALAKAAKAVPDWGGGTRLGEQLALFNSHWGSRGLARGSVVVILSDGWDRGSTETLEAEMARLARNAYRVIWVNPLKATAGYEPLVRGMAAALPYIDQFLDGHCFASLEALAKAITVESTTKGSFGSTRSAAATRHNPEKYHAA